MAGDSIQSPPLAVLQVIDERAANLEILGLTVQERNIRQLQRAGFEVRFSVPDTNAVFLRGDFQYPNGFFRALQKNPLIKPEAFFDVSVMLKSGEISAVAILEKSFFDEL